MFYNLKHFNSIDLLENVCTVYDNERERERDAVMQAVTAYNEKHNQVPGISIQFVD